MFKKLFGVVLQEQTYLNSLYLFLSVPLSMVYFVYLSISLILGVVLMIGWVGFPFMLFTMHVWLSLGSFERKFANFLLDNDLPAIQVKNHGAITLFEKLKVRMGDPLTGKSLLFLLIKLPLSLFFSCVVVLFLMLALSLLLSPAFYAFDISGLLIYGAESYLEAACLFIVGFFLLFASLHLINLFVLFLGRLADRLLCSRADLLLHKLHSISKKPLNSSTIVNTFNKKHKKSSKNSCEKQFVKDVRPVPLPVRDEDKVSSSNSLNAEKERFETLLSPSEVESVLDSITDAKKKKSKKRSRKKPRVKKVDSDPK